MTEFFAAGTDRFRPANRRRRNAIRSVTLLDAPASPLAFSADDYRDACLAEIREAGAWLQTRPPLKTFNRRRQQTIESALAVLYGNPPGPGKSVSALLSTVLPGWSRQELQRVAALLFETGLLRNPRQLDGPVWRSGDHRGVRLHAPTARRLFPGIALTSRRAKA